ncbi:hypothetical protein ACVIN2_003685 [Bradyrhizobium sp. USDA 3650]
MLCCALPISAVLAGGIFQVGAASWGVAGGLGLLAAAAVGALFAGRRRLAKPDVPTCQCSSPGLRLDEVAPPIACTLSASSYHERVKSIRALASHSLISARRGPLSLHLVYAADALGEVRALVRAEQSCCAFLDILTIEKNDGVHVTITAPPDAALAAEDLFNHFAPELAHQQVS